MDANYLANSRKELDESISKAALTMAIGIVVERVSRLSSDDRRDLHDLVKGLSEADQPDEVEAIRVAMREILEQAPSGVHGMKREDPGALPEKLQRWMDHAAQRVRKARKAADLTQVQLAKKSGLPQSHISRIESGKLSPSRATLDKIAKALAKPLRDFDPTA